jgi:methylmalonyl-CoA/ethylmalonyl-CoA epimerase
VTILDPWGTQPGDGGSDTAAAPLGIHHVNILVRDLEAAVRDYQRLLALGEPIRESLASREVETARFRIGDSWLVLVTPMSPDCAAAHRLASHGEGLFLLSLRVARLDEAASAARAGGAVSRTAEPRAGLASWRVIDLVADGARGLTLQLCENRRRSASVSADSAPKHVPTHTERTKV